MKTEVIIQEVVICELDKPNKNNRVYTTEEMTKSIEKFKESHVLGCLGMTSDGPVDLDKLSHTISDLQIRDGKLYGKINPLDSYNGNMVKNMMETDDVAFRLAGYGTHIQQEDGTYLITDFSITSINMVLKDSAA